MNERAVSLTAEEIASILGVGDYYGEPLPGASHESLQSAIAKLRDAYTPPATVSDERELARALDALRKLVNGIYDWHDVDPVADRVAHRVLADHDREQQQG